MTDVRMMEIVDRVYWGPWTRFEFLWFIAIGIWAGFVAQVVLIPIVVVTGGMRGHSNPPDI